MSSLQTLDELRTQLIRLQKSGQTVHASITHSQPKITLFDLPIRVKHASAQLFIIERTDGKALTYSTYQYVDLITRRIVIRELNKTLL